MNLNNNDDDSSVEIGPNPSPSSPLPPAAVVVKLEPGVAANVESITLDISREGSTICVDDVVITNNEDPIDLTFSPPSPPSSPPTRRRPGHQLNATPVTGAIVAFDPISTPATLIGNLRSHDSILAVASSKPSTPDRPKKKQKKQ